MESEGWKMRVVCVIWREDEVEEEEMKSRRRRRKERERERESKRGCRYCYFSFFYFGWGGGRELRKGRTRTLPYRMVTLLSLPGQSPLRVWYGIVIHPHSRFCGCSALRY